MFLGFYFIKVLHIWCSSRLMFEYLMLVDDCARKYSNTGIVHARYSKNLLSTHHYPHLKVAEWISHNKRVAIFLINPSSFIPIFLKFFTEHQFKIWPESDIFLGAFHKRRHQSREGGLPQDLPCSPRWAPGSTENSKSQGLWSLHNAKIKQSKKYPSLFGELFKVNTFYSWMGHKLQ